MKFGIDLLRHVFSIAVIVQHMSSNSRYSLKTNNELAIFVDFIDGSVCGFFLISGFLYTGEKPIFSYIKTQAIKLLIPFFVFSIIYGAALFISGRSDLYNIFCDIIVLHGTSMQLYFLPYMLFVCVTFRIIDYFFSTTTNKYIIVVTFSLLTILALNFPTDYSSGSNPRLLFIYFSAFSIGVFLSKTISILEVSCGVLAALFCISIFDHRYLDFLLVVGMLYIVYYFKDILPNKRLPGSGGVYLFHTPVVNFSISSGLSLIGVDQGFNIVVSVFLTYIICLGVTFYLKKLLNKSSWIILE